MIELILPRHCAGCGSVGHSVCEACRRTLAEPPQRVFPPVDTLTPVWALSPYAGVHRELVLAMKERGRRDVPEYLGAVLEAAIEFLVAQGQVPESEGLTLVPAPTRARSARLRGGDPVTAVCRGTGLKTAACVRHDDAVRDSVGLSAAARRQNLNGNIIVAEKPTGAVLLVDDVVTTGATLSATSAALLARKVQVVGALVICVA